MNLYNLVETIKAVSKAYPTVQEFGEGDIYSFLNSGEHKYPCIFLTIGRINTGENDTQTITGSLFYVDRLVSDSSNRIEVQSVSITALQNILSKLQEVLNAANIETETLTPFTEKFSDLCAGSFVEFTASYQMDGDCDGDYELGTLEIDDNGLYSTLGYQNVYVKVVNVRSIDDRCGDFQLGANIHCDNQNTIYVDDMSYDDTEIKAQIEGKQDKVEWGDHISETDGVVNVEDMTYDDTELRGKIQGLDEVTIPTIVNTTTNFTSGSKWTITTAFERCANLFGGIMADIKSSIKDLIPSQASSTNQLADKAFVNSTIAENAANFRGNFATWSAVPTSVDGYIAGADGSKKPTNNDYMVVTDASGYNVANVGSWRFKYTGDWDTKGKSGWSAEYKIGSTFTEAQQKAIDSTITSEKVNTYDGYESRIGANETNKVDKINTANKLYGTASDGTQTGYELGDNLSVSNGKINATDTVYDDTALKGRVTAVEGDQIKFYKPTGVAAKTSSPYCCAQWVVADEDNFVPVDGMTIKVRIPVAGSPSYGTCIKVNNELHPIVYNVNSGIGTRYGVNGTMTLTYNATQTATAYVDSKSSSTITGCWQMEDYDATNVYQLRHNSGTYKASADIKRYKVCVTDADGVGITPLSDGSNTSGHNYCTSFNPFGQILYLAISTTNAYAKDADVSASVLYNQNTFDMRYTFNGGTTMLTANKDVYLQCEKNSDGSFKLLEVVQDLPTTADGKYYIYLGHSYSAYQIELHVEHDIFYFDSIDNKIVKYDAKSRFSRSYNDLTDKPTIPSKTSQLTNDSNFVTSSYHDSSKQDALVSGTNIKTINNQSLLGSGNIVVQGSGDNNYINPFGETEYLDPDVNEISPAIKIAVINDIYKWSKRDILYALYYYESKDKTVYDRVYKTSKPNENDDCYRIVLDKRINRYFIYKCNRISSELLADASSDGISYFWVYEIYDYVVKASTISSKIKQYSKAERKRILSRDKRYIPRRVVPKNPMAGDVYFFDAGSPISIRVNDSFAVVDALNDYFEEYWDSHYTAEAVSDTILHIKDNVDTDKPHYFEVSPEGELKWSHWRIDEFDDGYPDNSLTNHPFSHYCITSESYTAGTNAQLDTSSSVLKIKDNKLINIDVPNITLVKSHYGWHLEGIKHNKFYLFTTFGGLKKRCGRKGTQNIRKECYITHKTAAAFADSNLHYGSTSQYYSPALITLPTSSNNFSKNDLLHKHSWNGKEVRVYTKHRNLKSIGYKSLYYRYITRRIAGSGVYSKLVEHPKVYVY